MPPVRAARSEKASPKPSSKPSSFPSTPPTQSSSSPNPPPAQSLPSPTRPEDAVVRAFAEKVRLSDSPMRARAVSSAARSASRQRVAAASPISPTARSRGDGGDGLLRHVVVLPSTAKPLTGAGALDPTLSSMSGRAGPPTGQIVTLSAALAAWAATPGRRASSAARTTVAVDGGSPAVNLLGSLTAPREAARVANAITHELSA